MCTEHSSNNLVMTVEYSKDGKFWCSSSNAVITLGCPIVSLDGTFPVLEGPVMLAYSLALI